ncbi:MAG: hypothetical protein M1818_001925 [Claussenomyces sp. TS43310]|nr:MAG: hypothetical protein M1818_001925 [Claussenomyces sp. TS43310]
MDSKRKVNGGAAAPEDLDDRSAKRRKLPITQSRKWKDYAIGSPSTSENEQLPVFHLSLSATLR